VQRPIEGVRSVSQRAIFTLQKWRRDGAHRRAWPEEVESLLRDMRALSWRTRRPLNMSHWMFLALALYAPDQKGAAESIGLL